MPSTRRKAPRKTSETGPKASRYQNAETTMVHRSEISLADYNPRHIDSYARKKLKTNIRKHGLQGTIVVNRKTGNVVSGHQRLSILDELESERKNGSATDYHVGVTYMDLTDAEEKTLNVHFNNQAAQGDYDLAKLEELLKLPEVNIEETGFDAVDLELMFDDFGGDLFNEESQPEETKKATATLEEIAAMKAQRKKYAENDEATDNDAEFYAVVLFENDAQRRAFMEQYGEGSDDRYLNGLQLGHRLGFDVKELAGA